ncbi:hypothetical protein PIB30_044854 [Stylosanthes scabra]|uniref:Uncharacterized protein n=1 Tax=Stylosanthes scabra TaxID=79078 RepID=A0ABU6ZEQ7_9FABA|nr:hypothetical protein [Stylosanthes scabra]
MEFLDFFMVATTTIGFIIVCKTLFKFMKWVWGMFLRSPKNLREYGSWAIITGSTDGIGKAMALELASKGINLLLLGRNPQKLEATSNEILTQNDVEVKCLVVDFEKENGEKMMKMVEEAMEGLDVGILVNNAGLGYPYARYFHEVDSNLMNGIIKVNVEGATWIIKAVIQKMVDKKKGAIINIGSGSSFFVPSFPLISLYAATKAYLAMLSRSMTLEYKHQGINIQCQVPLFVSTKMTKMRSSLFVPTAQKYATSCTRWIGYESVVVPHLLHSLQAFVIRSFPDSFLDAYILSDHLKIRKREIFKDSKTNKNLEASS